MAGLTVDRRVAAPPERVWRAVTDAGQLAGWFWPESFATVVQLDARPGGEVSIRSDVAGIGVSGTVSAVEPEHSLAMSWRWDGDDEETNVTILLGRDGAGTRLSVRHEGFADGDAVGEHVRGWNDCLDRLDRAVANA